MARYKPYNLKQEKMIPLSYADQIVLYGYSKGIISSRRLEEASRRNVVFMTLSADTRPHFTTIVAFVSELEGEIVALFRDVLLYCEELRERQKKTEKAAREMVRRHRERDEREK